MAPKKREFPFTCRHGHVIKDRDDLYQTPGMKRPHCRKCRLRTWKQQRNPTNLSRDSEKELLDLLKHGPKTFLQIRIALPHRSESYIGVMIHRLNRLGLIVKYDAPQGHFKKYEAVTNALGTSGLQDTDIQSSDRTASSSNSV